MEVVQDEQRGLTSKATVRGVTFRIDAALIGTFIRTDSLPLEDVPYPDSVDAPSMEDRGAKAVAVSSYRLKPLTATA
jgi:hypothetical protein